MTLRVDGITVRFGGLTALDDVTIEAPQGSITGLIGPNGAGKTTLFNVCSGFQPPSSGRVYLGDREVTGMGPVRRARLGIGRTFQVMELFRDLTVRENVEVAVEARSIGDNPLSLLGLRSTDRKARVQNREAVDEILALTGLSSEADVLAGNLPTGRARLLELARSVARGPKLLLLDEPSSGLGARDTERIGELLGNLVRERSGIGVLLVEHDMSLALGICQRINVLDFGRLIFAGTPKEVRTSDIVRDAYLGRSDEEEMRVS
jgi:ABC-type branched-subunit amino acid transport system ATPase component